MTPMNTEQSPWLKFLRLVTIILVSAISVWMLLMGGPKWYYSLILFSMVVAQVWLIYLERKIKRLKRQLGR